MTDTPNQVLRFFGVISLIALGFFLVKAPPAVPPSNSDPTPVFLSEGYGCRIFSFGDRGETHYFADCKNNVTTEINGKKSDVVVTRKVK